MQQVIEKVELAQQMFRNKLIWLSQNGGLTEERYVRLLTMQYHMTKGVQRHFLAVASHPDLARRRGFRKFLFDFANEEELHYQVAFKDLENLGTKPLDCPIDVKFWKTYFESILVEQPFIRLGGTCILENISTKAGDILQPLLKEAKFLNAKNTMFIVIHQHGEALPHGDQILEQLEKAKLEPHHIQDLLEGCRISTILYMRFLDWVASGDEIANTRDLHCPK
jgi:hypothetical protein